MITRPLRLWLLIVAAMSLAFAIAGCGRRPGRALHELKELEPKAKERNQEIRELTGVPADQKDE